MGIKLSIEITSPLEPEDRELLSGIAVMVLAIANHEMAKAAFPDAFGDGEEEKVEPPTPCGALDSTGDMICIGVVGHRGRHKFRPVAAVDADGLVN